MRGRPLHELLSASGPPSDWPEEVFAQISEAQVGRCLRTKRWKYSVTAPDKHGGKDPASDRYVEEFLYDLDADPHERENLVGDPGRADVRAGLAAALKRRMAGAGEPEPLIEPAG
jgi:arylsulfatase A-like enzyme